MLSAARDLKPPSAAAIDEQQNRSCRSFRPPVASVATPSSVVGRSRRPRRPGRRSQDPPPSSQELPLPCRLRQRQHDLGEGPLVPARERKGRDASCTKGSAPSSAPRSRQRKGPRPPRRSSLIHRQQIREAHRRRGRRPEGPHRSRGSRRQDSRPFLPRCLQARQCGRADRRSPCCGQQSSFTGPFQVVFLEPTSCRSNADVLYLFRNDERVNQPEIRILSVYFRKSADSLAESRMSATFSAGRSARIFLGRCVPLPVGTRLRSAAMAVIFTWDSRANLGVANRAAAVVCTLRGD